MQTHQFCPEIEGSEYDPFTMLASTSDQGLFRKTCDTIETPSGGKPMLTHQVCRSFRFSFGVRPQLAHTMCATWQVQETAGRLFNTEFKTTSNGVGCIAAISLLVERMTDQTMPTFTSTRAEKDKARVQIDIKQRIAGFAVICMNGAPITGEIAERLYTLSCVMYNVLSCSHDIPRNVAANRGGADVNSDADVNGVVTYQTFNCILSPQQQTDARREIMFASWMVGHMSASMQWTGALGETQHSSKAAIAMIQIAASQMQLMIDILNPDLSAADQISRTFEITRARGVALSQIIGSIACTAEAGRRGEDLQWVTKVLCFGLVMAVLWLRFG